MLPAHGVHMGFDFRCKGGLLIRMGYSRHRLLTLLLATAAAGLQLSPQNGAAQASPDSAQSAPAVRVFNDPTTPTTTQTGAQAVPSQTPVIQGGSHGPVQAIQLSAPNTVKLAARKDAYTLKVSGDDWVDAKLVLAPPDRAQFTATGTVTLADGRKVDAGGAARGWKDLIRKFPANDAPAGALIGRIGNDPAALPFLIGDSKALDVNTTGELYLRINASTDLAPMDGSFAVSLKLGKQTEAAAAALPDLTGTLSPALFANIPRRVQDEAGDPGDMVNFAIIGTEEQVTKAFTNAGWTKVDKTTQDAIVHGLLATLAHESYTEMPMSTLFLFGRSQDMSYARADPISVAAVRHHLRLWKSTETVGGRPLWVGSSTHDNGFEKDQRNGGVTHHIDPQIDKERDFIEQSFAAAGDLAAAAYVTPANPLRTARTATGGTFESDGRIVVLDLR